MITFLNLGYFAISVWMLVWKGECIRIKLEPPATRSCKNLFPIQQMRPATLDFSQPSSCIPTAMMSSTDVLEDRLFVRRHQSIGGDLITISYTADGKQMWRPGETSSKPFVIQEWEAHVTALLSRREILTNNRHLNCQTHFRPCSKSSICPNGALVALPLTSNADWKSFLPFGDGASLLTTLLFIQEEWVLERSSCLFIICPHAQPEAVKVLWHWSCGRVLLRTQLSKQ